jgi:hypothetical protein
MLQRQKGTRPLVILLAALITYPRAKIKWQKRRQKHWKSGFVPGRANAKLFDGTARHVIASEAKQSPLLGVEIASPACAGAGFAALLAMT